MLQYGDYCTRGSSASLFELLLLLLENGAACMGNRNSVNYQDTPCLNLEAGASLSEAEQDECEPAAPVGKKTSASQNGGGG